MKAIIPVAGRGSRLFPIGIDTPKCLVKVLNKSLIQWNLETLLENGIRDFILVIGSGEFGKFFRDQVAKMELRDARGKKAEFQYVEQPEPQGTAHALQMAAKTIKEGEEFIYMYGDNLYSSKDIKRLLKSGLGALATEVENPENWGIFSTDTKGNLKKVVEKPKKYVGNLGNMGCYYLNYRAFELFKKLKRSVRGEFELTDTLNLYAQETRFKIIKSAEFWFSLSMPWDLFGVSKVLMKGMKSSVEGEVEDRVTIKGKLVLPKSSKIRAGTYIDGDVVVGENTEIGPNAYLRDLVVIGNECKISFNTELKNVIVGDWNLITKSYLADSVLGNDINFPVSVATSWPRSAIVSNRSENVDGEVKIKTLVRDKFVDTKRMKFGTIIGDGARIGVNTVIYPGVKIWPNSRTEPNEVVKSDLINRWG